MFDLRCLLYHLPNKPLPPFHNGSCLAPQPRWLQDLYNVRDVRTTLAGSSRAAWLPAIVQPYPHPPEAHVPPDEEGLFGFHLAEEQAPPPEPFTYALLDVFETFGINGS